MGAPARQSHREQRPNRLLRESEKRHQRDCVRESERDATQAMRAEGLIAGDLRSSVVSGALALRYLCEDRPCVKLRGNSRKRKTAHLFASS